MLEIIQPELVKITDIFVIYLYCIICIYLFYVFLCDVYKYIALH